MHYYNLLFDLAEERRLGVNQGATGETGSDPYLDVPPEVFIGRLEPYERVLIDLKDQLYEGSWERILEDLRARMDNKPYIYKLSQTITRDVAAIERMKSYEMRQKVSLSKLLHKTK